jgi:hypothetical protein
MTGASIPIFVATTEVGSLSASVQHDDADTLDARHASVAGAVFESCSIA